MLTVLFFLFIINYLRPSFRLINFISKKLRRGNSFLPSWGNSFLPSWGNFQMGKSRQFISLIWTIPKCPLDRSRRQARTFIQSAPQTGVGGRQALLPKVPSDRSRRQAINFIQSAPYTGVRDRQELFPPCSAPIKWLIWYFTWYCLNFSKAFLLTVLNFLLQQKQS